MSKTLLITLIALLGAVSAFLAGQINAPDPVLGRVTDGLAAATSTVENLVQVNLTAATIFETRPNCASRLINTGSTTLMISFGSTTPTVEQGSLQAASTSVIYDGGLFGCEQWRAIGLNQTGTIFVTEFR